MTVPEPVTLILIALMGYFLFYVLNLPTPALLGPFVIVLFASLFGADFNPMSNNLMVVLQILLGINIGCKVTRNIFLQMRELVVPSALMISWTLILSFGMGWVLIEVFQLDVATALLSAAPAGIAEMGILAVSLDGSVGIVSLFQLSRLVVTLIVFPVIIRKLQRKHLEPTIKRSVLKGCQQRINGLAAGMYQMKNFKRPDAGILPVVTSMAIGLAGGLLGHWMQIPAGPMMGSFFLVAGAAVAGLPLKTPPAFVRTIMMLGIGLMIGLNAVQTPMASIRNVVVPMIAFALIMYLSAYGVYRILRRVTSWDRLGCILAAAPGGITPMALLADEYSENPMEVALLHMIRLLTVKMFVIPVIISFLV